MARPINPKSLRQLALRNGMPRETLRYRLDIGMDKIDAITTERRINKKTTLEHVLEVEKIGLSVGRSAYILGISQSRLSEIIIENNINWRGKREYITKRG